MSTEKSGTAGLVVLVPVWMLIVFGGIAGAEHQQLEERQAAAAAASYEAYVEDAAAEQTLHRTAYATYVQGRYHDALEARDAALTAADDALTASSGKVDTAALADTIARYALAGETPFLREAAAALATATQTQLDQLAAWQAEQDRLAAERVAAEEAARQAAATEVYTEEASYSEPEPVQQSPGPDFTLWVYGWGGQEAIDACAGAVWFDGYGGAGLAEHWQCGGSSFPDWAGAAIDIPGVGLYESVGVIAVMDTNGQPATAAPYGYADLFYQTCYGGDSTNTVFIGLNRIG